MESNSEKNFVSLNYENENLNGSILIKNEQEIINSNILLEEDEYTDLDIDWDLKNLNPINIHTIGDNSCYYHTLLYILSDTYKDHSKIVEYFKKESLNEKTYSEKKFNNSNDSDSESDRDFIKRFKNKRSSSDSSSITSSSKSDSDSDSDFIKRFKNKRSSSDSTSSSESDSSSITSSSESDSSTDISKIESRFDNIKRPVSTTNFSKNKFANIKRPSSDSESSTLNTSDISKIERQFANLKSPVSSTDISKNKKKFENLNSPVSATDISKIERQFTNLKSTVSNSDTDISKNKKKFANIKSSSSDSSNFKKPEKNKDSDIFKIKKQFPKNKRYLKKKSKKNFEGNINFIVNLMEKKQTKNSAFLVKKARQKFCDDFRRSIGNMMINDNEEENLKETLKHIKQNNIGHIISKYCRSLEYDYEQFDKETLKNNFEKIYLANDKNYLDNFFINNAVYIRNDPIFLTKNNINEIFENEKITIDSYEEKEKKIILSIVPYNVRKILKKIKKIIGEEIFINFVDNCYVKIIEGSSKLEYLNKIRKINKNISSCVFDLIKNVIDRLKYYFCDKNNKKSKKITDKDINQAIKNSSTKNLIMSSMCVFTEKQYTVKDYKNIMEIDPRKDFDIDSEDPIYELPLTLNYFKFYDYTILEKYNLVNDEKIKTVSLENLKKFIFPSVKKYRNKEVVQRRDAGWEDFVPIMSQILGTNIHIVSLNNEKLIWVRSIPEKIEKSKKYKSHVIIISKPSHFEVMANMIKKNNKNLGYQTIFEYEHPFIQYIYKLQNSTLN